MFSLRMVLFPPPQTRRENHKHFFYQVFTLDDPTFYIKIGNQIHNANFGLHWTKFADRTKFKYKYAQRVKNINISMIGRTSLKGEYKLSKKQSHKKVNNLSNNLTKKNEQLFSTNVPENQMVRVYQNAYDDLSDMEAAIYFNHYLQNTDLVEKRQQTKNIQVFKNQIWNEYVKAVAKLIVKQNGIVYLVFNNEERYQHFVQFRE